MGNLHAHPTYSVHFAIFPSRFIGTVGTEAYNTFHGSFKPVCSCGMTENAAQSWKIQGKAIIIWKGKHQPSGQGM